MKPTANRNLFNADCNTYFYRHAVAPDWQKLGPDGRFLADSIHAYVDMLARQGVDTLVYNPSASRAWWPSKTTPTAWDGYRRGDRSYFEGMELDWTRANLCCEPVASAETIAVMTQWHGEIAALCRARAGATGRPYHLGLRLPANFGALRPIGLDVRAMVEAFIDFLCPTRAGYSTTWDLAHDRLRVEWGERVAIYGVVENAPNWLPTCATGGKSRATMRASSASPAIVRGNAAGKLVLGADGIETYNFFCADRPDYTALRGLADLDYLRGKRKFYAFNTGFEMGDILTTLEVDQYLPLWMEPNMQRRFRLPMCVEPAGMQVTVQLVFERPADGGALPPIGLSFNDSWPRFNSTLSDELLEPTGSLTHHIPENVALNFTFPARVLREGWNDLVVAHGGMAADLADRRRQGIMLVGIELLVEPVRSAGSTRVARVREASHVSCSHGNASCRRRWRQHSMGSKYRAGHADEGAAV
jgi:hypothetical protein